MGIGTLDQECNRFGLLDVLLDFLVSAYFIIVGSMRMVQ